MYLRVVRRALVAGLTISVIAVGLATADVLEPAGDVIIPGGTVLVFGNVSPGQTLVRDVPLTLRCSNSTHVAHGTTVTVTQGVTGVEAGGSMTVTDGSVGPVPSSWPLSGSPCPTPVPSLTGSTLRVTVVAPTVPGPYQFLAVLDRTPTTGVAGSSITASFTVVGNTPPSVTVPADFLVDGDTTGGWTATYAPTATDAEDDPDPVASCLPAPGTVLPLGATTVTCSATDHGGLTGSASFTVTVQDRTPPVLAGLPTSLSVETSDPTGADVSWSGPTATDVVDPAPTVGCVPASGSRFGIGTTPVQCTARDAIGNTASASFTVTVSRRLVVTASWDSPVGDAAMVSANLGRTLPLKATVAVDGGIVGATGGVRLVIDRLTACGGDAVSRIDGGSFEWDGGRWVTHLDTSTLATGCWRVAVEVDGAAGGAFDLRLVDGAVGGGGSSAAKPVRAGR